MDCWCVKRGGRRWQGIKGKSEKLGYLDRRFRAGPGSRRKNGFLMTGYMSTCILGDRVWWPRITTCISASLLRRVLVSGGAFSDF